MPDTLPSVPEFPNVHALWPKFKINGPADQIKIEHAEHDLGVTLPSDYRAFLLQCNGGEGELSEDEDAGVYCALYRAEELVKSNNGYGFRDNAPDLLLIGTDRGGEGICYDKGKQQWRLVLVPLITLDVEDSVFIASSFRDFITSGRIAWS